MKINKIKPPKNREFLGLVAARDSESPAYWDFFWWATKENGVNGPACYVDRGFFNMPKILGWIEVPELEAE